MRAAVIFYHSNIDRIYQPEWIEQCVKSIYSQTYKDYNVIELNYGDGAKQYTKGEFNKVPMANHIYAMNWLLDLCFTSGYDVVFNTNMDDNYAANRFEVQMEAINQGYQLVSSNMRYIGGRVFNFSHMDIAKNLAVGHNIIAHPVIAMHRTFWDGLRYDETKVGSEDLLLWQQALGQGKKFYICHDVLLNYRLHQHQVGKRIA